MRAFVYMISGDHGRQKIGKDLQSGTAG